ncbi:MAG: sigma 54-interacting transcriptional regulator [Deltaproteobacteria bacterium]|nr:sigma 54-interacting transcriptional regulator [Deltaproteobacteria bacterium]
MNSEKENNISRSGLYNTDRYAAWQYLYDVLARLVARSDSPEKDALLVETSLELANVSFVLGIGFSDIHAFLQNALNAAARLGDRRSQAMIHLHLGRLYYFGEQRHKAIEMFALGKSEVESLGDEDILTQASEFIGLYYFIQGMFKEALGYFERATESFESNGKNGVINPSGPMWLSYSAAFLGHTHRAIGNLDYYRRVALERGNQSLATTLRSVLGIILIDINKTKEAAFHLSGALQEAVQYHNSMAGYFAKGGLAYHHFKEGRIKDSRKWMIEAVREGAKSGLIRQYASPWVLELLYEFHRHKLEPIPELDYHDEISRLLLEPNIHLRGVALRLRAVENSEKGSDDRLVESDLQQSETYLRQSGDPVQLAKTQLEMARLKLRQGKPDAARLLAHKAWRKVSGYGNTVFPDDLRQLLSLKSNLPAGNMSEELINMFTEMVETLVPCADLKELMTRTVKATNQFFGAERGGIFLLGQIGATKSPVLMGSCNLSDADVSAETFKSNLALVFKAFRENRPQIVRSGVKAAIPYPLKAVMCVPFVDEDRVKGVLYHDNSYIEDCFDHFDDAQLLRIAGSFTRYIGRIRRFSRQMEGKVIRHLKQMDSSDSTRILTQSPLMQKLLAQAKQVAGSNSTILILGETGVGKELLARDIHNLSPRRDQPLVIVDPTTIPETLIESELFGHEKGAFTGADRQKLGRIELAHRGTLFIDEVGEIPKSSQVKLLRVLQEKTLIRVGGTKTISSDFRLIAATNRSLADEVAAGRFREDLYYRLNVISITLPPLRERNEDVLFLARHFLSLYAAKHNQQVPGLARKDEDMLLAYHWPGNIRELKNVMERAVLLSTPDRLEISLPVKRSPASNHCFSDITSLDEMQRRYIQFILEKTGGKISGPGGAAELLDMKRTSLYKRMSKLGLR